MQYKIVLGNDLRLKNYKENFLGIQQSVHTQDYILEVVKSLVSKVPQKSSFVLDILARREVVVGTLRVTSASVKFVAEREASCARDLIDLISEDIVLQVGFWSKKRLFRDGISKDIKDYKYKRTIVDF